MKSSARAAMALLIAVAMLGAVHAQRATAAPTAPSTNVIGGNPVADDSTYPFLTAVLRGPDPVNDFFCGGTLIADKWVMTAAHCLAPSAGVVPNFVAVGSADRSSSSMQVIPVVSHYQNPDWNPTTASNDIMILRLAHAPTGGITPVVRANTSDNPDDGASVTVAGWGLTTTGGGGTPPLHANDATLEVMSFAMCSSPGVWGTLILPQMICASHSSPSLHNACNGDSGGPLLANGKQVGIVSFGVEGCYGDRPGVFTRVSAYRTFVDGTMQRSLGTNVDALQFGSTFVDNGAVTKTVNYRSDGDQPVTITGVSTTSPDYVISGSSCNGTISPEEGCQINITFDPTAGGQRAGSLVVTTDSSGASSAKTSLAGTGIARATKPMRLSVSRTKLKYVGGKLKLTYKMVFKVPVGIPSGLACGGKLSSKLKVSGHTYKTKSAVRIVPPSIGKPARCYSGFSFKIPSGSLKKKAKLTLGLPANDVLTVPTKKTVTLRIR